jgi:HD superfamily phosphohydrolase
MRISGLCFVLLIIPFSLLAQVVPTVLGSVEENNPLILQLLESRAMQRLKQIDQSGPPAYFFTEYPRFSRYDHSVGVYALLKRFNVSEQEQIAGLLHDASHTVFSHVADSVFQTGEKRKESYQDSIHHWYLEQMDIKQTISSHALTLQDISPKNPQFTALEQAFPDMNADRIEYNLHTALVFADLSVADVEAILSSLRYENKKWYFTDTVNAQKFAKLSTYYTRNFWGASQNAAVYHVCTVLIKYALQNNIITKDEMHFGVDVDLISKLKMSQDKNIKDLIVIMSAVDNYYVEADNIDYDVYVPIKMRGIDPLVQKNGKLQRLTSLSLEFKNEFNMTAKYSKHGVRLKFVNVVNDEVKKLLVKRD